MFKIKILLIILILISFPQIVYAKRGCCSNHGGVSGCNQSGRQICNDGTLSPTCRCNSTSSFNYDYIDESYKGYNENSNISGNETKHNNTLLDKKTNEKTLKNSSSNSIFIEVCIVAIIGYILYKLKKHKNNYN